MSKIQSANGYSEIKKETEICISAKALLSLLYSEWQAGSQGSAGFGNACSIFREDKSFSELNQKDYAKILKNLGAKW